MAGRVGWRVGAGGGDQILRLSASPPCPLPLLISLAVLAAAEAGKPLKIKSAKGEAAEAAVKPLKVKGEAVKPAKGEGSSFTMTRQ